MSTPQILADDPFGGQLFHETGGFGVADAQFALEHTGAAIFHVAQKVDGLLHQFVFVLFFVQQTGPRRDRRRFTRASGLPVVGHGGDLRVGDETALNPLQLRHIRPHEQHIAATEQPFRTRRVENNAAIDLTGDGKGDTGGKVGLDQPRHNISTGALGCQDQVDASGARHLCQATNLALNVIGGGHHQVGQLVDNEDNVGQRRQRFLPLAALGGQGIIRIQVTHTHRLEELVTVIHLQEEPGQRTHHLIDFDDHLAQQMGNAVIALQLDHLGIDHDKAQRLRPITHEQADNNGIDTDGFTRPRRASDQHMGRTGNVHHNRRARGVTPQRHRQRTALFEGFAFDDAAHTHHHFFSVWHFDAHIGAPRHRRFDAHRRHSQRQRQIISQAHNVVDPHLAPLPGPFQVERLNAKLGDSRPALNMDDPHRHVEIFQCTFNQRLHFTRTDFAIDAHVGNQEIDFRQTSRRFCGWLCWGFWLWVGLGSRRLRLCQVVFGRFGGRFGAGTGGGGDRFCHSFFYQQWFSNRLRSNEGRPLRSCRSRLGIRMIGRHIIRPRWSRFLRWRTDSKGG